MPRTTYGNYRKRDYNKEAKSKPAPLPPPGPLVKRPAVKAQYLIDAYEEWAQLTQTHWHHSKQVHDYWQPMHSQQSYCDTWLWPVTHPSSFTKKVTHNVRK